MASNPSKEKRSAAPAPMAPRMQSQVQKWAKMTAELGDRNAAVGATNGSGIASATTGTGTSTATADGKKTKKTKKRLLGSSVAETAQSTLRAPHRRDRYPSLAIGAGLLLPSGKSCKNSKNSKNSKNDKNSNPSSSLSSLPESFLSSISSMPPTCLLCLARFPTRQRLRDHEALSAHHRLQMRDSTARRAAIQRYAKVAERVAAASAAERKSRASSPSLAANSNDSDADHTSSSSSSFVPHIPIQIRRVPRRRGDLAPVYTSYAVPLLLPSPPAKEDSSAGSPSPYHCCLLCRRRFRSRAVLRLHERESTLHRARTRDPEAVAAAAAAVQAAADQAATATAAAEDEKDAAAPVRQLLRMRPLSALASSSTAAQYRDRARERRLAFGQKGVPGRRTRTAKKAGAKATTHASSATSSTAAASAAKPGDATALAGSSKGAAMLGKMGWTAGLGLGAQGTGRTEAIAPTVYMPGVGLGAQGGKLGDATDVAARRTGGSYADFVEQAQEAARLRYQALDRAEAEASRAETENPSAEKKE